MDYEKAYKAVLKTATQWIKDGCTDKEKICLECVFPELRESEDERIRKWLIDYFGSIKKTVWIHRNITCEQILAWLEKQKEPEWSDIDREMLDRIIERGCCELPPRTRALTSDMVQWLQWMKEGRIAPKPAECIEDSVKFEEGFKTGRESGLRDGQKYVLDNAESYGLCKPAEWSEEDEKILNELLDHCNTENATWYNWLKRLRSQPKRGLHPGSIRKVDNPMKWMEEDEKEREQKPVTWSEDDEKMLDSVIHIITHVDDLAHEPTFAGPKWTHPYTKEIAWLKSLRPSWKPSEEQMEALRNAAAIIAGNKPLIELYENLKNL